MIILSLMASGTLYKWTDAQGMLRFSDRPPPPDVKKYLAFDQIQKQIDALGATGK